MYPSPQHITFIKGQTINSVLSEKQNISTFIEISVTATIEEVFDVLLAENIISVSVYRLWRGHKQPIAIVNVFDLVSFVCLQPIFDNDEVLSNDNNSYFLQKPIGELIGLTPESTNLTVCHTEDPLVNLLDLFTRKQIHRVLVSTQHLIEDPDIGKVINEEEIPLQTHNQELLLELSSITIHDQALTAFKKMHQYGVEAVAIVNDGGSLVGEISAADLRGLNKDRLSDLKKPVIMFLKSTKGALIKPLICHQKFTLSQVMASIVHNKAHRAWVVDENDIPIGVITLTDILSILYCIVYE
ncbi:15587_t:CDS:2 [Entrophospora sp. SA101]|nr:10570_t:CDS:2 [Entrophospora sp. SA101]CAJ0768010.1 15587_t:CDS:2 [Entrophospora sp. SA101]